jgi:hypothetical protein
MFRARVLIARRSRSPGRWATVFFFVDGRFRGLSSGFPARREPGIDFLRFHCSWNLFAGGAKVERRRAFGAFLSKPA